MEAAIGVIVDDGGHDGGRGGRCEGSRLRESRWAGGGWDCGGVRNGIGAVSRYRGYRPRTALPLNGEWVRRTGLSCKCNDGLRCALEPDAGIEPSVNDRTEVISSASECSPSVRCSLLLEEE